jgi:hypothetical protein
MGFNVPQRDQTTAPAVLELTRANGNAAQPRSITSDPMRANFRRFRDTIMPGQELSAAVLSLRHSELIAGSLVSPEAPHNGGTISPSHRIVRSNSTNDTSHIDGTTGADAITAADGTAGVNENHGFEGER